MTAALEGLTSAQRDLLGELKDGPRYAIWRTAAVKTLLRLGLIEAWGNDQMAGYQLTDVGRALITGGTDAAR